MRVEATRMQTILEDLRDAVRSLRKHPRFLLIASLTLALGIGAVAAIFSVVNGVLFTPLAYPHADRLANIWSTAPGLNYNQFPLSPDLFFFYRKHNTVFDDMALLQQRRSNLTEGGVPEVVDSAVTTHSYFATVGAGFSRGRPYSPDEDKPSAPRVVVISHRLWERRYGSDPGIVGRGVRVNGQPTEIVGVAPKWMDERGSPDVWIPARFNPENPPTGNFGWNAVGRLKEGVTPERAESELNPLVQLAMREYIKSANYRAFLTDGKYRPLVHSMKEDIIGDVRQPLWILLGTVAMVLLVACGNVANLCLVRAEARQREIAVRVALGSGRGALVRKLLMESFILAAVATVMGVACAAVALPVLLRLAPDSIPRLDSVRLDTKVLAVSALGGMISAIIFGLVPAIRYTRPGMLGALRHGGRSATDHPSKHRDRHILVIAQTAMALVLLVGSGLLARSFARLMGAEQGFQAKNAMTFRVALPETTYANAADVARFTQQLVDRLAELPGIEAAGATSELPIAQSTSGTAFEFEGHPIAAGRLPPIVHYTTVTPGFFRTMQIRVLSGSDFDSSDQRESVRTVIVNKTAADQYWPGQDPIGKRLRAAGNGPAETRPWYVVKGTVAPVRYEGLRSVPRPIIYFPLNPADDGRGARAFGFVVRGPRATQQADALRQAVWALNPDLPVASMETMDEIVSRSVVDFTFTMLTLGIAASIALLLGAIGLYGVLSYAVSLRTREIGVRLALGAPPARVKRSILANAAGIAAIGLAIGAAGAFGLTRFLGEMLFEVEPLDLPTFAGMSLLLFLVALIAAYLPARKAASVSPMEAMRTD
jgi:putative ABC transport system permease protein